MGTTRNSKPTSSNDEDPLNLDTLEQNRRTVEENDLVNPSRICDSFFEEHSTSLSVGFLFKFLFLKF